MLVFLSSLACSSIPQSVPLKNSRYRLFPTPSLAKALAITFSDGEALTFAGMTLIVNEIGAGEAKTMSMFYVPSARLLFTGDLVSYEMTGFLLENRLKGGQNQLLKVQNQYAQENPQIIPGHG